MAPFCDNRHVTPRVRAVVRRVFAAVAVAAAAAVVLTVQGAGAAGPGNVNLKKAVNYAIDRQAMLDQRGAHAGVANDQYLPPGLPGFADAALYPSRPDVERARQLAGWRPGDPMRRAVMYTCNAGPCIPTAQIVQANLAQIGIDVEIQIFPRVVQFTKAGTRGEPFDLTLEGWHTDYYDPYGFLFLLDGGTIRPAGNTNFAYFDDPDFRRRLSEANALPGQAHVDALGALDVHAATNAAPLATYATDHNREFFSARIGCHTYHGPTGTHEPRRSLSPQRRRPHLPLATGHRHRLRRPGVRVLRHQLADRARDVRAAPELPDPDARRAAPAGDRAGLADCLAGRADLHVQRFATGSATHRPRALAVTAAHFKHALERLLTPSMSSPGQSFVLDIVGATDMLAGRATTLSGVVAEGNTLRITLVRPAGDFLARLAMPFACPLPLEVPIAPGGIQAPVPSAGPYYIAEWQPKNLIRLERNPYYGGTRHAFFDRFEISIGLPLATIRLNVESGAADYGPVPPAAHAELAALYGPGSSSQRWFANPAASIRYLALNHDRPLFGTNPPPPPPPVSAATAAEANAPAPASCPRRSSSPRSGVAPIRIRCGGAACRGTLALFARPGTRLLTARKPVKLGQARFSIPRAKTKVVRVRLSKRAFKTLKRAKRLRAQAVVTLRAEHRPLDVTSAARSCSRLPAGASAPRARRRRLSQCEVSPSRITAMKTRPVISMPKMTFLPSLAASARGMSAARTSIAADSSVPSGARCKASARPTAPGSAPLPSLTAVSAHASPSPSAPSARRWAQREISSASSRTASTSPDAAIRTSPCAYR